MNDKAREDKWDIQDWMMNCSLQPTNLALCSRYCENCLGKCIDPIPWTELFNVPDKLPFWRRSLEKVQ